jgi:hypothetical protein
MKKTGEEAGPENAGSISEIVSDALRLWLI